MTNGLAVKVAIIAPASTALAAVVYAYEAVQSTSASAWLMQTVIAALLGVITALLVYGIRTATVEFRELRRKFEEHVALGQARMTGITESISELERRIWRLEQGKENDRAKE